MSLASWKKQFYPVPADDVQAKPEALRHCLRMWTGLRKANLRRHGARLDPERLELVFRKGRFRLECPDSCALCQIYWERHRYKACTHCPLHSPKDACRKAFVSLADRGDPEPMLSLLRERLEKESLRKPPKPPRFRVVRTSANGTRKSSVVEI